MGDEAEWIIDSILFGGYDRDDLDEPAEVECRYCGAECYWQPTEFGWRLYKGRKPHRCKVEFDNLDSRKKLS